MGCNKWLVTGILGGAIAAGGLGTSIVRNLTNPYSPEVAAYEEAKKSRDHLKSLDINGSPYLTERLQPVLEKTKSSLEQALAIINEDITEMERKKIIQDRNSFVSTNNQIGNYSLLSGLGLTAISVWMRIVIAPYLKERKNR
ncbi:hypothetical protein J4408_01240 [Candidatus Pacearchaeota archaeon]|nr:hypothetical protein [Candidatus Pacearchaeota archaeon]